MNVSRCPEAMGEGLDTFGRVMDMDQLTDYFTKAQVGRGTVYLYIENVAAMFSGYIFWLVITRVTTPDIIGISATIVSFSAIVVTIVNMGIPISIQKFLGKTFVSRNINDTRMYVKSSLILLLFTISLSSLVISLTHSSIIILTKIDLDPGLMIVTILLVASTSLSRLLRGIIIATLNTKVIPIVALAGSAAKFVLSFFLIVAGLGVLGLTIGIASFTVLESIFFAVAVTRILKRELTSHDASHVEFWRSSLEILRGGFPNWVPNLITSLGAQLGTILVFGSFGANSAGLYFISYSIYSAIEAGMSAIFSISYPVLSTVDKGRRRISWRVTKLGLVITTPLSMSLLFYSSPLLKLFGNEYASGSFTFEILLLSMVPVALTTGITNLVYANGLYRQVMLTGIAMSLPRTLLYFVLVPYYGGVGAAISFTAGSVFGLIVSLIFAKSIEFKIRWKQVAIISFVPLIISYIISLFSIYFMLSILLSIIISYLAFFSLRILDKSDVEDAILVLPKKISSPLVRVGRYLRFKHRASS